MPGSVFLCPGALYERFWRLFAPVRARVRVVRIDPYRTPSECLCYAVGMSDALPGVAIRQAAKQSSRLAAASLSYTLKAGEGTNKSCF